MRTRTLEVEGIVDQLSRHDGGKLVGRLVPIWPRREDGSSWNEADQARLLCETYGIALLSGLTPEDIGRKVRVTVTFAPVL